MRFFASVLSTASLWIGLSPAFAAVVLLDQNFESPNNPPGFINSSSGQDVSQQTVNELYGNQPAGFIYAQSGTVETLNLAGGLAFGTGYVDTGGTAGTHMLGMLATDLLGLSFDVGGNSFLNVSIDITSIDLQGLGGPFNPPQGVESLFRFSLFDNPSGVVNTGSGTLLDSFEASTSESASNVVDFTNLLFGLDASGATNGNVILQVDLVSTDIFEYAGFDNVLITADTAPPSSIPLPAGFVLLLSGGAALGFLGRRRKPCPTLPARSARTPPCGADRAKPHCCLTYANLSENAV